MAVAATVHRQSSVSSEVRQPQLLARSKSDRQYSRVQTLQMWVEIELRETSRATPTALRVHRVHTRYGCVAAGRRSRSVCRGVWVFHRRGRISEYCPIYRFVYRPRPRLPVTSLLPARAAPACITKKTTPQGGYVTRRASSRSVYSDGDAHLSVRWSMPHANSPSP